MINVGIGTIHVQGLIRNWQWIEVRLVVMIRVTGIVFEVDMLLVHLGEVLLHMTCIGIFNSTCH